MHSQLRNEIIEKEEEIENLLREIENYKELEAENIKLKVILQNWIFSLSVTEMQMI